MTASTALSLELLSALTTAPFMLIRQPAGELPVNGAANGWTPPDDPFVIESQTFRFAQELDVTPDLLIVDSRLATIGLVHVIEASSEESLHDQAARHVDQATYLRHLLVTHGLRGGTSSFAVDYTIECVLVVEQRHLSQMIDVVRHVASTTRFLLAIGLNLLTYQPSSGFDTAELRRAFAWLLPATREWMSGCEPPAARVQRVELLNYRLPGRRVWKLEDNHVHLLHGANGTGKSTIAEALELVVTGSVERLRSNPQPDYAQIIRNAQSFGQATVTLSLADRDPQEFKVVPKGIEETPLASDLPVSAFRLDQTVMDQLIRTTSQQRARILTKAFFPGGAYENLESAQETFNQAYRELPANLREEIARSTPDSNEWPSAVVPRLEWVEAVSIPEERIDDCLPVSREHLEALGLIVPEITASLQSLHGPAGRPALEDTLKQLDEAVGRIRSNVRRYSEAVVQSLDALRRLDSWTPTAEAVTLAYADLLHRWTEGLALGDLLKKHLEISTSLLQARSAGWRPAEPKPVGLMSESVNQLLASIDDLSRALEKCNNEEEEFFKQLQSSVSAPTLATQKQVPAALTIAETESLNLVGGWWGRQQPTPPGGLFGETIAKALSENTSKVFGTITIGGHDWTSPATEFLTRLQPGLDALLAFESATSPESLSNPTAGAPPPAAYRSPVVRLHSYEVALTNARKVVAAYKEVESTLMKRLTEHKLNQALDELITLFTPARWAYEGLSIDPRVRDGKVTVNLTTTKSSSQAEMRLNTAELNVFVLALFLLCGPTIKRNPLGTLILDDPLQNMDELTSATVARGVARIASLLPEAWQLILMFHGEEDLETFRQELPGIVYYLPWLGPLGAVSAPDRDHVMADMRRTRAPVKSVTLNDVMRVRAKPHPGRPAARSRTPARSPRRL